MVNLGVYTKTIIASFAETIKAKMIAIYQKTQLKPTLKKIRTPGGRAVWINLISPKAKEISWLSSKFLIPKEFIASALDPEERPHCDSEGIFKIFILRIPILTQRKTIKTVPLTIVVAPQQIITICLEDNEVLKDFEQERIKDFYTSKKTRFLLQIFGRVNFYYKQYLDFLEKEIETIEKKLLKSFRNEEIIKLLNIQKSLLYFNTASKGNGNVLEQVLKGEILELFKEDKNLLENIVFESRQVIETVEIFNNLLANTMDAYASIISNNLNIVMKFLASITIILSIPTIIASLYGMNIGLPLEGFPHSFWLIISISLFIMFLLTAIFIKLKYL